MSDSFKFSKDIVLSVAAPVYNEEDGIEKFVQESLSTLEKMNINYELILVNDGSKDKTFSIISEIAGRERNVRIIDLSRNFGREIAMTAGLEASVGDYVVIMDSDMQDPPQLIPQLLQKLIEESLDVVYAARTSRDGESFFKKLSSKIFYRAAKKLTGLHIPDNAGDFRVFSRKVVNSIVSMQEHNRYLKMLYAYVGFRVSYVEFERLERFAGKSSYNYWTLFAAAADAIFAFSNKPLRILSLFSVGISFSLFCFALFVFLNKLFGAEVQEGWTSLMLVISLMFSILFIFLAILSEYISRILVESKNRPLYYIRDEIGSTKFDIDTIIQNES